MWSLGISLDKFVPPFWLGFFQNAKNASLTVIYFALLQIPPKKKITSKSQKVKNNNEQKRVLNIRIASLIYLNVNFVKKLEFEIILMLTSGSSETKNSFGSKINFCVFCISQNHRYINFVLPLGPLHFWMTTTKNKI